MTEEAPSKVNNTQGILRANENRVCIVNPLSRATEDTNTTITIDPKVAPSVAFKIAALKNLSTHHPELETFLKPLVERFGSSLARVFFKQRKSNDMKSTQTSRTMFRRQQKSSSSPFWSQLGILRKQLPSFLKRQNTSRTATTNLASLPPVLLKSTAGR